jgi:hypothetical protein
LTGFDDYIIFSYVMKGPTPDHGLEFLLAFDGRIHHLNEGYWLKFEIKRMAVAKERPHGLSYSFTLHAPDGTRLVGFDNAHRVPATGLAVQKGGVNERRLAPDGERSGQALRIR